MKLWEIINGYMFEFNGENGGGKKEIWENVIVWRGEMGWEERKLGKVCDK